VKPAHAGVFKPVVDLGCEFRKVFNGFGDEFNLDIFGFKQFAENENSGVSRSLRSRRAYFRL
jgi:hypothetical protein